MKWNKLNDFDWSTAKLTAEWISHQDSTGENGSEHFRGHPKPHLMPRQAFKHLQRPPTLVRRGKGRKEGRPLNVAIEMWRGQNACSDRSPCTRHTANTKEISTLPSRRFIEDHASQFSKLRVRMHYSTLHRWNSWPWCWTSRIHNCNQWDSPNAHAPCCQLPSVTLRVCSIDNSGNWAASVALDMWQSLLLGTPRQIQLSSSFLSTCNWTSPKSDWAAPVTLTKKGRKFSKAWWHDDADEQLVGANKNTSLHSCEDCWQLSATLPVI